MLPPEDQRPGVYFISSLPGSKRKFTVDKSFWYIGGLSGTWLAVAVGGSMSPEGEGGW